MTKRVSNQSRGQLDTCESRASSNVTIQQDLRVPHFGDKRAVAAMADMSVRWVDLQLPRGMPHLKIGARRVRFDLEEVASWLKERYGTQRFGPTKGSMQLTMKPTDCTEIERKLVAA